MTAYLSAIGACTSLGFTARSAHAAMRARLVAFEETSEVDQNGEPIRASRVAALPPTLTRAERMSQLASAALQDLGPVASDLPLLLALPEKSGPTGCEPESFDEIWRRDQPALAKRTTALHEGRAAFFLALEQACQLLHTRRATRLLVGGVDSLCAAATLHELGRAGRLLGASPHGLIPGEGAALMLLEGDPSAKGVAVTAVASGRERSCFLQDAPNRGEALSRALSVLQPRRAELLFTCETGEPFWVGELSKAYLRNVALMPEPFRRSMAAQTFGDLGASAGAVMCAMAAVRLTSERAPGLVLILGSSDGGQVGTCQLERARG